MGYESPMPVQEAVIPYLLSDEFSDVVALAQTGTGKTASFGLPLIQKIDLTLRKPQALILSPTRELCLQIANDLKDYSKYIPELSVLPMYGGTSIENQIRNFKRGVHIIVATPGRLIDLMDRKVVSLDTVRKVVMDEADEMLDMGFTDSINSILERVPQDRTTLMFSATMSPAIAKIAKNYLHDPKEIVIGNKNEGAKSVNHVYYMVHDKDKYLALKRVADYYPDIYAIVFCRTRAETQEVADKLIGDGYSADALHGDLSQAQRDFVMGKFRQRRLQILVATDVAARGLDVDDLTHVINYGLPDDIESYTHRSGRTGRAGKTGTSISIINMREKGKMRAIEKVIGKQFVAGKIPTGKEICEKQLLKVMDEIEKVQVNEEEISTYLPEIYRKLDWLKLDWLDKEDLIKRVVSLEFNHFLEYYSNAREIEVPEQGRASKKERNAEGDKGRGKRGESRSRGAEPGYSRLFVNLGKKDGISPALIIDMLNHNIDRRIDVGRIDLMQNFSFFEVRERDASTVVKSLANLTYNGRPVNVELASAEDGGRDKKPARPKGGQSGRREGKRQQEVEDFRKFFDDDTPFDYSGAWYKKHKKRRR